ncbi:transcriptional regulator, partial [Escherichia coli]|nr:transcriptional regulator [Escherichia coli]
MKNDTCQRLREERERLGLSQVAMSDIGGVKKLTQLRYEKGDS